MSQIDPQMEQIGRHRGGAARLSSVASFAGPLDGAVAARPLLAPWLSRGFLSLRAAVQQAADAIATWRERARMRHQLLLLDDRLLRDIGISRLQARSEAEKPFWRV